MTTEQIVRDQLDRATQHVQGGPNLEASIEQGRRKRRQRHGALGLAALAVVGMGAVGVRVVTGDDSSTVRQDAPVAAAPAPASPGDFVPGTDIDEKLAAVVAAQLPALSPPDDVYPSDSHTAGPIDDAEWASAEDWQATYTLDSGNSFGMITGLPSEGFSCESCNPQTVPGGTIYHETSQNPDTGVWQFGTWLERPDGSYVGAFEYAPGDEGGQPPHDRALSDAALERFVQDPGLTFAALGATAP
jgi:hypothetical protein